VGRAGFKYLTMKHWQAAKDKEDAKQGATDGSRGVGKASNSQSSMRD